ncbi:response regulator transcription factor [Thalassotalea sp. PLHSN55]|uniref:response regulator transcription factor n=1 Tax=Thalassotalea sp. PLHSN55 TaxID=3435888 RepID=UPI003F853F3C
MSAKMINVLLIEDDHKLGLKIKRFLEKNDCQVDWLRGGSLIGVESKVSGFDVILCDIDLPDMSGFDICTQWREQYNGAFIFITAFTDCERQIAGLELGADDYIVKPFQPDVLLARIKANLRRSHTSKEAETTDTTTPISLDGYSLDPKSSQANVKGNILPLTRQEFSILYILTANVNHKVTRDAIYQVVLNKEYDGFDRTADVYVSKLRKKFNAIPDNHYQIDTVWGKGYVLNSVL